MNALEFFFRWPCPAPASRQSQSHNTLPIRGSITHIDGYPRKLVLYLMEASPYWQVRYFEDGRTFKRSTRTTNKQDAIQRAKEIFADIVINRVNGRVITRLRGHFATERPRESRRLQPLREWSHEQVTQVFPKILQGRQLQLPVGSLDWAKGRKFLLEANLGTHLQAPPCNRWGISPHRLRQHRG